MLAKICRDPWDPRWHSNSPIEKINLTKGQFLKEFDWENSMISIFIPPYHTFFLFIWFEISFPPPCLIQDFLSFELEFFRCMNKKIWPKIIISFMVVHIIWYLWYHESYPTCNQYYGYFYHFIKFKYFT